MKWRTQYAEVIGQLRILSQVSIIIRFVSLRPHGPRREIRSVPFEDGQKYLIQNLKFLQIILFLLYLCKMLYVCVLYHSIKYFTCNTLMKGTSVSNIITRYKLPLRNTIAPLRTVLLDLQSGHGTIDATLNDFRF